MTTSRNKGRYPLLYFLEAGVFVMVSANDLLGKKSLSELWHERPLYKPPYLTEDVDGGPD